MLPEHAPFSTDQRRTLEGLLCELDAVQRGWLSGFLASATAVASSAAPASCDAGKLLVLFGTESGNSETLADRAVKEAKKRGFQATMRNMSECLPTDLASVPNLLVIVSTWGDGEPPESAAAFHMALMSEDLSLVNLRYSVCALGDTSYEKFCQTGKDVDARLETLGATRVAARQDCDVDFEENFTGWLDRALAVLAPNTPAPSGSSTPAKPQHATRANLRGLPPHPRPGLAGQRQ